MKGSRDIVESAIDLSKGDRNKTWESMAIELQRFSTWEKIANESRKNRRTATAV